jgi:hypothetical protein
VLQSIAPVHLTVFLGDLFDEGSIATRDEYASTLRRFQHIFGTAGRSGVSSVRAYALYNLQKIFLAGDNDIGGEGSEPVSADAVRRFADTFVSDHDLTQHDLVRRLNLSLFVVDAFQQTATCLPLSARRGECTMNTTSDSLRVVLTHSPAMQANTICYRLVQHVNGGLILSAHDHQVRASRVTQISPRAHRHAPSSGDGSLVVISA